MTQFTLAIWARQMTGQATGLALVVFFGHFPRIVMTPPAGALVDRWNRKLVMTLSDLAAGVATIAIFALLKTGHLEGVAPLRRGRGEWLLLSPGARRRDPFARR
jgi:MFS family permease